MQTKSPETCQYDIISLGEVMLRLDPGEGRIHTARSFRAWEGGGEYNVARGLRRCFELYKRNYGRKILRCNVADGTDYVEKL